MGSCNNSVSEEGAYSLHLNNPCLNKKLLYVKSKGCYPNDAASMSLSSNLNPHPHLGGFKEASSTFEELSDAFAKRLQVVTPDELLSGEGINANRCEINYVNDEPGCQEVKLNEFDTVNPNAKKRLEKSATFPCSEDRKSTDAHVSAIGISSMLSGEGQNCQGSEDSVSIKSNKAACIRSVSLPSTLKLLSAMKGGREQQGLTPKANLTVKWAPDVYDPPATSISHSVKSHQQRPKARKKDKHKHKHKGSRSTRGNTGEKQRWSRNASTSSDPLHHPRLQPLPDRMLLDGFSHSGVEMMEYANSNNESKCGSSFLVGSLAKLRFSMAEAS